ncbi:MAG: gliding motility-associated C-terminal domain-containing protein [Reichenbachiella sp.]
MNTISKSYLYIFLAVMSFSTIESTAQVNSVLGRFTVDFDKGCSGMTVNVTQNGTFDTPRYYYEGFDGGTGSTDLFYVYTTPGEYYLTLVVNDGIDVLPDGNLDSLLITVTTPEIPEFTVHNCDVHVVRVEINEDYYDRYNVEFSATDSELVDPLSFSNEFVYGIASNPTIRVTGIVDNGIDNCGTDLETINTIDAIVEPVITSAETTLNSPQGSIQLVHTLGSDVIYNLNTSTNGSDNFIFEQNVDGPQSALNPINTSDEYFCYQIDTYDACNETSINSNIVCSVLFNVQSNDGGNLISWETDTTQALSYSVLRDGNILRDITTSTEVSFIDTTVICQRQYIYNVQPIFTGGSSIAVDTAIVANQSGDLPPITENPSSTILNNGVVLDWGPPDTGDIPFRKYLIEKNINNRGWLSEGSTIDTTYTDADATFVGLHSYRITYDDECGNISSGSPSTDPIIIQQVSVRGREVTYSWNRYETWLQGIRNYTLERVDSAGNLLEEYPVLSGRNKEIEFDVNDLTDKYMRVRAESLDETPQYSYSNIILTRLQTEMFLPTAFTPDGDNLNDVFYAKGPAVFNFRMEIYNRWGILIFGTDNNLTGWDGMIHGEDSPEGTYIYKIYFEDGEGQNFDQSGAFTLLRQR